MTNPEPTGQILYIQMNHTFFEVVELRGSTYTFSVYLGLFSESLPETMTYSFE